MTIVKPDPCRFRVGWATTPLSFEQIMADLRPQIVRDLLYFKKMSREHLDDLLQQGWLRLWKALYEDENLLADLTMLKAADFVTNRAGATQLQDYLKRYDSYHTISRWDDNSVEDNYEESITEIVIGSSLKSTGHSRHALFTRTADLLIDIETAICAVAEWCMDDMRKLAALYYLTTRVSQIEAGQIAGLQVVEYQQGRRRCRGIQYWVRKVLAKLQEAFAAYKPLEPNRNAWREALKAGNTEPVAQLGQQYEDDPHKLIALYALTTRVPRETLVKECGINDSKLWYATKQVRRDLRNLYRQAALADRLAIPMRGNI